MLTPDPALRGLGIDRTLGRRVHPTRLDRLLAEAAAMTVQHIADLEPARRTAILVAQVAELETRLADATLADVREVHRLAVHQGAEPRRVPLPGHQARCRSCCCCSAARSRR